MKVCPLDWRVGTRVKCKRRSDRPADATRGKAAHEAMSALQKWHVGTIERIRCDDVTVALEAGGKLRTTLGWCRDQRKGDVIRAETRRQTANEALAGCGAPRSTVPPKPTPKSDCSRDKGAILQKVRAALLQQRVCQSELPSSERGQLGQLSISVSVPSYGIPLTPR